MEAHLIRLTLGLSAIASMGATVQSPNFTVTAPTKEMAQQVARHAEHHRSELAKGWLGHELPRWFSPCPITVKVGQMGAGGYTSFSFDRGSSGKMEVFGWKMVVQGSLERILDSVIPHEVSHTIFACHFRRPLPRWADEGAATLAEDQSEKRRQILMVEQILNTSKRIPLRQLLDMTEYPDNPQAVLSLYAQGYTLAELLVQKKGKAQYLEFLAQSKNLGWDRALKKYYGYNGIDGLNRDWTGWIVAGCPRRDTPDKKLLLVGNSRTKQGHQLAAVVRGQSPGPAEGANLAGTRPPQPKQRRLVAPVPTVAARRRPSGKSTLLTRTSMPIKTKPRSADNRRYNNDGWIAVRTSGQALAAMSTTKNKTNPQSKSSKRVSNSTSRQKPRRPPTKQIRPRSTTEEMPAHWPMAETGKSKSQARIPANRRPTRWSKFPRRPSSSLSRDNR